MGSALWCPEPSRQRPADVFDSKPKLPKGAGKVSYPGFIEPALATLRSSPPAGARGCMKLSSTVTASRHASVLNLVDRASEDVLDHCERNGIGFIPWFPLAAGELAKSGSILDRIAKAHGAAPSQIALAWVLKRSPVMFPIPGTPKVAHLKDVVAAGITLSDDEFAALDRSGKTQSRWS